MWVSWVLHLVWMDLHRRLVRKALFTVAPGRVGIRHLDTVWDHCLADWSKSVFVFGAVVRGGGPEEFGTGSFFGGFTDAKCG